MPKLSATYVLSAHCDTALQNSSYDGISATQRTSENIDGSKNLDGILLENVYIGLAEYYSAELSQKIRRGMNESRQKRQYTGGFVLFGYDVKDKKYVINETEAEIVRQVYADYANGRIVKDICKELAERGIKNKFGRPFVPNTIYRTASFFSWRKRGKRTRQQVAVVRI